MRQLVLSKGVIPSVNPSNAELFRKGKAELLRQFGNKYIVFDNRGILLPNTFDALMSTRNYKEFQRKQLRTLDDVSFLRDGFFVAHHLEPETKFKVWGKENHYVQNELVDTIVYLSSDYDAVHMMQLSMVR